MTQEHVVLCSLYTCSWLSTDGDVSQFKGPGSDEVGFRRGGGGLPLPGLFYGGWGPGS